jgi:hypothetical protein
MCVTITDRFYCGCEQIVKIVVCAQMQGKKGLCPIATTELNRPCSLCRDCNNGFPSRQLKTPERDLAKSSFSQPALVAAPVAHPKAHRSTATGMRGGEDRNHGGDCSCCCGSCCEGCCEACGECGEACGDCIVM